MPSIKATTLTPESIEHFRSSSIVKGQSENTAKAYSTDLRMFLLWVGETHHLPSPNLDMEMGYELAAATWLNETRKDASPKTTGRRLTSLRSFARWAGYPGLLVEYKAPTPGKSQPHPLPGLVNDLERMVKQAWNDDQRALIGLCGFAGLRLGESLDCRTRWLDASTMRMTVRGKGDKERVIPISPRAWELIAPAFTKAMVGNGYLISYPDRSARKTITILGRKAGVTRKVSSHDLRATFATEVHNRTGNMRLVQELLGHANITTTEVYTGVLASQMKSGVDWNA